MHVIVGLSLFIILCYNFNKQEHALDTPLIDQESETNPFLLHEHLSLFFFWGGGLSCVLLFPSGSGFLCTGSRVFDDKVWLYKRCNLPKSCLKAHFTTLTNQRRFRWRPENVCKVSESCKEKWKSFVSMLGKTAWFSFASERGSWCSNLIQKYIKSFRFIVWTICVELNRFCLIKCKKTYTGWCLCIKLRFVRISSGVSLNNINKLKRWLFLQTLMSTK